MKLQLALHLLLLTILQLYYLPPPPSPPVSNSSCLFTRCQPLYASCCTVLLYFSRYCSVRLKMFYLFIFMYYLCEKYYKPITVQYYIADCVSWIPRLTLLDLQTNWTDERALRTRTQNSFLCRGLTVSSFLLLTVIFCSYYLTFVAKLLYILAPRLASSEQFSQGYLKCCLPDLKSSVCPLKKTQLSTFRL